MNKVERHTWVPMDFLDIVFKRCSGSSTIPEFRTVHVMTNPFTEKYEVYTPNSVGPRAQWKSFEHYKCVHSDTPLGLLPCYTYYDWLPAGYRGEIPGGSYAAYAWPTFGDPGRPISDLPEFYEVRPDRETFIPEPMDLGMFEARACKAMLPLIKAELSLVNSVIELKDFKKLPQTLRNVKSLMKYFVDVFGGTRNSDLAMLRKYGKKYWQWSLRNLFRRSGRTSADVYLEANFDIMPLISDICGIHTALTQAQRRINDLVSRAGRHQVKHWCFNWNEFVDRTDTKSDGQFIACDPITDPPDNFYHMRRKVFYEPTSFHAEIRYNYLYNDYQRALAPLLGLLDSLGVNPNPAIVWNAIPWSFVVDWVLGVSQWLDQFKMPWMEPQINIQSYLWSVKRKRRIVLSRFDPGTNGRPPGPEMAMPTVFETAYSRQVRSAPAVNSILSSGLTLKEFSLGAALLVTRRRRRRK